MKLRKLKCLIPVCALLMLNSPVLKAQKPFGFESSDKQVGQFIQLWETYQVVAFGETHSLIPQQQFYKLLISHPKFLETVDVIITEWATPAQQQVLDDYVMGKEVSKMELRKAWRHHNHALLWAAEGGQGRLLEDLLKVVRSVNLKSPDRKIRVLGGDSPMNWSGVEGQKDWENFRYPMFARDVTLAQVIINEVMAKEKKALIIYGSNHVSKINVNEEGSYRNAMSIVRYQLSPLNKRIFVVKALSKFGGYDAYWEQLQSTARFSVINLKQHEWGDLDAFKFHSSTKQIGYGGAQPRKMYEGAKLNEVYDALMYFGQPEDLKSYPDMPPQFDSDEEEEWYWNDLKDKYRRVYGKELDQSVREEYLQAIKDYKSSKVGFGKSNKQ